MATTDAGRRAEGVAADWLMQRGFSVLDRNWRTRTCEIDIVALHNYRIHFVEVKYRRSNLYGSGIESVTPAKIVRLRKAAREWLHAHPGKIYPFQIDVMAVSGYPAPSIVQYMPNVVLSE